MEEIKAFYNFGEDGESDDEDPDYSDDEDMHGELEVDLELDERGLVGDTINLDHGFGTEVCHLSF